MLRQQPVAAGREGLNSLTKQAGSLIHSKHPFWSPLKLGPPKSPSMSIGSRTHDVEHILLRPEIRRTSLLHG